MDKGAPTKLDETALVSGTLAYGILLQAVIPERWHVPANAAAALASVAIARRAGVSAAELFRGALLGVMLRRHGTAAAVARASLCFGLWHVPPTLPSLRSSALGRSALGRVGGIAAVAAVVAVTAVAGTGFAALRLRTSSVIAAVLAHAAINATAYVVARSARR